jgi:hypothetical protein
MATDPNGRPHLRLVAIDGVAVEDAPRPAESEPEDIRVEWQRREITRLKEQLRRLRAGR